MGTNYYVNTPSCANACEHCAESERIHLGKSSAGWRFLFRADPEWPRDEAFTHWVRRALSGPIVDEYGRECSLAELLDLAHGKADGIDHLNRPPERQYGRTSANDFKSCGHDFNDREFS
jgi:hypothetical protein